MTVNSFESTKTFKSFSQICDPTQPETLVIRISSHPAPRARQEHKKRFLSDKIEEKEIFLAIYFSQVVFEGPVFRFQEIQRGRSRAIRELKTSENVRKSPPEAEDTFYGIHAAILPIA